MTCRIATVLCLSAAALAVALVTEPRPAFAQDGLNAEALSNVEKLRRQREQLRTRSWLVQEPAADPQPAPSASNATPSPSAQRSRTDARPEPSRPPQAQAVVQSGDEYVSYDPSANISYAIQFDYDSDFLNPAAREVLRRNVCPALQADIAASPSATYFVMGHTDAAGPADYNERLSVRRARSTRNFLVEDCGIPGDRLRIRGLGERHLKDGVPARAAEQRRVEFQVRS